MEIKHITIALTGASGALYGFKIVEILKSMPMVKTHLVISSAAKKVIQHEVGDDALKTLIKNSDFHYDEFEVEAPIASGSFPMSGMIIAPCSLNSAMTLANGLADNLITRAGQVCLKERRTLLLLLRESPLAQLHLENLARIASSGGIVMPASPHFYFKAESVDELIGNVALKALSYFDLDLLPSKIYNGLT
jgi:flavin prenyltransferase